MTYDMKVKNHSDGVSQVLVFGSVNDNGVWISAFDSIKFKPSDTGLSLSDNETAISIIAESMISREVVSHTELATALKHVDILTA